MASIRKRKFGPNKDREAWVVDYVDQRGKRCLKTFPTKKAAETWRVNALHEVQLGTHTAASSSKTITEAWELWLGQCEADGLEFGTVRQRRQHLTHHVKDFIGRLKLSDLTMPHVYAFDTELREAGRSLAMRRKVITNLKTCLSFAQGRGLVAQNVARGVRIKSDMREISQGPLRAGVDFPFMAELNTLIETAKAKWRPFIVTAIFTGMRMGELRGLRWSDIDLDAGVIHVRQRADSWGRIGPPKSKAGKRDIPLAPIVVNTLRVWRDECPKGQLNLVFPNGQGNPERPANIHERLWVPLLTAGGLTGDSGEKDADGHPIMKPRYHFYLLRHAAASLFIHYLGWTPKRVQTVMGHASVTLTFDLYGHLFENLEADRADMAKIEAAIRAA